MYGGHWHLPENEHDGEFSAVASVDARYSCGQVEDTNSADDFFAEIGLVLVIVLGVAVGINLTLTALHMV
jgi:hypothetical protein